MIFAGTNGYLDTVPVGDVTKFERGLLAHLRSKYSELLDEIGSNDQKIAGAIADKIKAAIEDFAKGFA